MDYGFELDPGEVVTKVVYRSILDFLPTLLMALLLAGVAAGLAFMYGRFPQNLPFPPSLVLILIATMCGIAMIMFLVGWHIYRRNFLVFTTVHLVQVEKTALFQERVSQLSFVRIEDVTGQKSGLLQSVFNYGNVQVQSAGEQEKFIFRNAPRPVELADEILEIHEQCIRPAAAETAPAAAPAAPPSA